MCPQGIYQAMPVCFHIISGEWMVMVFKTFWVNIQKAKMATTTEYWIWLGTTWICEKEMWSCYDSNLHTESPRTTRIRARIFFTALYFSNLLNFLYALTRNYTNCFTLTRTASFFLVTKCMLFVQGPCVMYIHKDFFMHESRCITSFSNLKNLDWT